MSTATSANSNHSDRVMTENPKLQVSAFDLSTSYSIASKFAEQGFD